MRKPLHKHIGQGVKKVGSRITKYLYERDTIFATIWVFIFIVALKNIPINTYVLNPIKMGLKDFDYTDLAYAELKKGQNTPIDNRIVIINIDTANRKDLGNIIEATNSFKPTVIGLDVLFDGPREPENDSTFIAALFKTPNIVLASRFKPGEGHTESEYQSNFFQPFSMGTEGYVNFFYEDWASIREWNPYFNEEKDSVETHRESFAASLVKQYDTLAYNYLISRHKKKELINYERRQNQYLVINWRDVINGNVDTSAIQGKIALLGYISNSASDIEDKKFTPMNKKFAGKSIPDMNGIVIHANAISMVLDHKYIKKLPAWVNILIAVIVCWLHMSFFIHYYLESHIWFHLAAKIAQVLSAILFAYLGIFIFDQFNIKLDMKFSLIVIIMAVDVIYFYEAWATWMHKKYNYRTVFKPHH